MSKHFITFGAGDNKYINAGNRLCKQANDCKLFDNIELYGKTQLQNNNDFWKKHRFFIEKNSRGFGYWLWKPFLIKKKMETMNNGDILLYLDCGCEIDIQKKTELEKSFKVIIDDKIIGTMNGSGHNGLLEKDWSKMDLILYLNMNEPQYINSVQRQGGSNMFYVCKETKDLVNEWYTIACIYHLLDDTRSKYKNSATFKEHRHDQSIFSLLSKKHNLYSKTSLYDYGIIINRNYSSQSKIGVSQKKHPRKNPLLKMKIGL